MDAAPLDALQASARAVAAAVDSAASAILSDIARSSSRIAHDSSLALQEIDQLQSVARQLDTQIATAAARNRELQLRLRGKSDCVQAAIKKRQSRSGTSRLPDSEEENRSPAATVVNRAVPVHSGGGGGKSSFAHCLLQVNMLVPEEPEEAPRIDTAAAGKSLAQICLLLLEDDAPNSEAAAVEYDAPDSTVAAAPVEYDVAQPGVTLQATKQAKSEVGTPEETVGAVVGEDAAVAVTAAKKPSTGQEQLAAACAAAGFTKDGSSSGKRMSGAAAVMMVQAQRLREAAHLKVAC